MSALKHSKRRFICSVPLLLLFAALLPFLIGCKETNSPGEQQTVPKVTTAAVIQQETTDYDEYTGRTEAPRNAVTNVADAIGEDCLARNR